MSFVISDWNKKEIEEINHLAKDCCTSQASRHVGCRHFESHFINCLLRKDSRKILTTKISGSKTEMDLSKTMGFERTQKLTQKEMKAVQESVGNGMITMREAGKRYAVSRITISRIMKEFENDSLSFRHHQKSS